MSALSTVLVIFYMHIPPKNKMYLPNALTHKNRCSIILE